jgi:hypothetical protein
VVLVSGLGCCSRAWQTVRGVLADCPRGVVRSFSSRVLERFGFNPVGQLLLTRGCLDRLPGCRGLSARHELLADCPRTWYGPSAC